ncbi:hypothetical protein WJX72_003957 [[Myrmecia] bisecta]|uniref:Uncharacterized protein n=1 Tax=[Myrmecia] bisecta TaxID=41462 RepID=A0AAW1QES7_9CHLO
MKGTGACWSRRHCSAAARSLGDARDPPLSDPSCQARCRCNWKPMAEPEDAPGRDRMLAGCEKAGLWVGTSCPGSM